MIDFQFSDLHCHPTLKGFGQSFSIDVTKKKKKANIWYNNPPEFFTKALQKLTGITRFSQADFTTLSKANVKLAFVSFYPFEKGFFTNPYLKDRISAVLSSFITSIGYRRVRYIQNHLDYFKDLLDEYHFLLESPREKFIDGIKYSIDFVSNITDIESNIQKGNCISIIPTIEGAHIFNTGLGSFGKQFDEDHILGNIDKIKKLNYPPLFITFAHNFNNDLCGHAPSLECLGSIVNQNQRLNSGFTKLGFKVLHNLLSDINGKPIFIDVKHMSLKSRLEYYKILKSDYNNLIPIIVSHGAVTGRDILGNVTTSLDHSCFANESINFYDEELTIITESNGLFALQFDAKRLGPKHIIKKSLFKNDSKVNLKSSALIVWRQLQHVAEILDSKGLFAWGTCCIGSDFDGTINPLEEVWTASNLNALANELIVIAENYLSKPNALLQQRNKSIDAETVVTNFTIQNTLNFVNKYYVGQNFMVLNTERVTITNSAN